MLATSARILDALQQPVELTDGPVTVSASIGMAVSARQDRGVEEFLRKADLAMYEGDGPRPRPPPRPLSGSTRSFGPPSPDGR